MANSPEVLRPNHRSPPQTSEVAPADDIRTIMLNQVAWGAVFAGAAIALVMQIILNMIGLGVGLSTLDVAQGDTPSVGSISVSAGTGLSFREFWRLGSEAILRVDFLERRRVRRLLITGWYRGRSQRLLSSIYSPPLPRAWLAALSARRLLLWVEQAKPSATPSRRQFRPPRPP